MPVNDLRNLRFPAWLAIVAMFGATAMPISGLAIEEAKPACTHLSSDGASLEENNACADDAAGCAHFCSALIHAAEFNVIAIATFYLVAPSRPPAAWQEQPPHPPPIA